MTAPEAALPARRFRAAGTAAGPAPDRTRAADAGGVAGGVADVGADADDSDLLARARAGDRRAFGDLVRRHHSALAAILRPRCGADVPMEDLLQEVFARALAHVDGFRGGASFLTWSVTIGLHLASDWRRGVERRRRLAPTVDIDGADAACPRSAAAAAEVDRRDEVERARRALADLPETVRTAVTLRVVEDLSYDVIASRMGAPRPRVRQWVCRGLRRLRDSLEDRHGA